jgi:hypothetical protein
MEDTCHHLDEPKQFLFSFFSENAPLPFVISTGA